MARFGLRRRSKADQPVGAASVNFTPRLLQVIAYDGHLASYGSLYRELAPVRTVVDFLADAVSTTSLKVYRRTDSGRPEVRMHPMAVRLREPEPTLSGRALVSQTVHDLGVYGNGYWRLMFLRGDVAAIVPMPPERVVPRGGDLLAATVFDFYPLGSGVPITLSRDEVVHFRLYNPEDRRIGSSKLAALRPILLEEIEASRSRRGFWGNAARQDFILSTDEAEWPDDKKDRFAERWRASYTGAERAGRTALLFDGMKPYPISFSAKDAEFIEGRKFVLEAAARVFNIPVSLLSLTETATFASQKEFHKTLYQDTLPPWYQIIESEIATQLAPHFADVEDVYAEFNVESKLRGSFEEQAAVISTSVGRPWMTVHEARDRMNLPDRADPTDDELAIPTNNVSLGPPTSPPPPSTPPVSPNGSGANGSAMPQMAAASRAASLKDALDHQARSVLSRVGAGGSFDVERWNRKLALTVAEWGDTTTEDA